jgi:hypothetical protein
MGASENGLIFGLEAFAGKGLARCMPHSSLSWGYAGMDTTVFLVFDPTDSPRLRAGGIRRRSVIGKHGRARSAAGHRSWPRPRDAAWRHAGEPVLAPIVGRQVIVIGAGRPTEDPSLVVAGPAGQSGNG